MKTIMATLAAALALAFAGCCSCGAKAPCACDKEKACACDKGKACTCCTDHATCACNKPGCTCRK